MTAKRTWAINVEDVSKRYRLGSFDSNLREAIADKAKGLVRGLRGRETPAAEEFWALRDLSFQIAPGQVVGVIGHNGAGKSTLLKILARITEPTKGAVQYVGRVGSLLEVGTGFHPELSGRDNVFLNGAVLGMTHREVLRHFDAIVDFAGVEPFLDTPVKRYSSGMYMRLAFAVAAHLESEILLVDEVLAVGDAEFQKRCLRRIGDMAHDGRTVVFVSHNLTAVQSLCHRTVLLEKGRVVADGATREVLQSYLRLGQGGPATRRRWARSEAPQTKGLRLLGACIETIDGGPLSPLDITKPFRITVEYERLCSCGPGLVSVKLANGDGVLVFDVSNPTEVAEEAGVYRESCLVPADLLNAGDYRLTIGLHDNGRSLDVPEVICFQVLDSDRDRRGWYGAWEGVLRPRLHWTLDRLECANA
ncbi:ABC transporter ATP-binding protein [Phenylobacterium sp.]|jgi:lipopolysaccharide transport system ATP-binding protein|uniref:ABC transporter ATP-binding protein n=1 Tax=Phenylobacterium sp. TaxID=1871053 RepID=UPI0037848FD9